MSYIGETKKLPVTHEFEWRISSFCSLLDQGYNSPVFSFAGEYWAFSIFPHGTAKQQFSDISLYLRRMNPICSINIEVALGFKTSGGKKYSVKKFIVPNTKDNDLETYGTDRFLPRSQLLQKTSVLQDSDVLIVFCALKNVKDESNTDNCCHCKTAFDPVYVSSHEQKCLDKPNRCPTCKDVVELRKWYDYECEMARVKATEKLNNDLKNIFDNKEHSDITIKVKDEEFFLHRNILAGRNPYFNSMFKTDMKEKTTGIVSIDDCEPAIFRSLLNFVYTGKVDEISLENVCDLYKTADKYQEDQLKEECLCFMKAKMSVESFCDFIVLALEHDENELFQNATDFFCRNTKEVGQSVKWQIFMKEHFTEANELYLKAFDCNVK